MSKVLPKGKVDDELQVFVERHAINILKDLNALEADEQIYFHASTIRDELIQVVHELCGGHGARIVLEHSQKSKRGE